MNAINVVPNIISGTVTRNANSQRRTPNWLKAVYAFLAAVVGIVALSLCFAGTQHTASPVKTQDNVASYNDGFLDGKGECK